jgi:hypothetical protein
MRYRHSIFFVILAVLSVLSSGDALAQAAPPATLPPAAAPTDVARLQNLGTFVSFMNLASGTVRLLVIVTPSSPSCQPMLDAVAQVLQANPSKRLRAYVVLAPLGPDDSELRALNLTNELRERRLVYLIDAKAVVAAAFAPVVKSSPDPATGVCFLYDTDAHLALEPPAPSLWMSANPQIKGVALDAKQLGQRANEMVRRVEQMANEPAGAKK